MFSLPPNAVHRICECLTFSEAARLACTCREARDAAWACFPAFEWHALWAACSQLDSTWPPRARMAAMQALLSSGVRGVHVEAVGKGLKLTKDTTSGQQQLVVAVAVTIKPFTEPIVVFHTAPEVPCDIVMTVRRGLEGVDQVECDVEQHYGCGRPRLPDVMPTDEVGLAQLQAQLDSFQAAVQQAMGIKHAATCFLSAPLRPCEYRYTTPRPMDRARTILCSATL